MTHINNVTATDLKTQYLEMVATTSKIYTGTIHKSTIKWYNAQESLSPLHHAGNRTVTDGHQDLMVLAVEHQVDVICKI